MLDEIIVQLTQDGLKVATFVIAPVLGASLLVGLVLGFFQALTQIQEVSLQFVPKFLVVSVILVLLFPWMFDVLSEFTKELFASIPVYIKGGL